MKELISELYDKTDYMLFGMFLGAALVVVMFGFVQLGEAVIRDEIANHNFVQAHSKQYRCEVVREK